jgi:hypothetical protein
MKNNEQVFSKFTKFKASIANQTGKKIKVLLLDNGEDTSKKFNSFCKEARIKRELTVPYKLQPRAKQDCKEKK